MVDGRFDVVAFLQGLFFRQADVSRFRIGIGNGRHRIVIGPAPCFRGVSGKEVVCQDFCFVIGLVAEGGHAVDVAQGPDILSRRFQKFVRFDVAALVQADVGIFQVQQFRHGPDARSDQDFFGGHFAFFAGRAVAEGQDLQAVALADGNRVFV